MDENIKEKVLQIVNKVSGHNVSNVNKDADLKTYLKLDSIQIVELFAALEMEFNIELPLEMMNVKSGQEFLEKLEKELAKKIRL
jgi:acyl carrier protein